jgi:predicted small lipoprotein YifL
MRIIAATTLLVSLLAGCGQMGPLYLPGEAPPERSSTPVSSEPAGTGEAAEEPAAVAEPAPPEN